MDIRLDAPALPVPATRTPTNVLFVFPQFVSDSFWAFKDTCRIYGAKAPAPPLGMMTVAAMLPQNWSFRLVNRTFHPLTEADLDWADLVMTGGMLPQAADALQIIKRCKARGTPVCVGGPDATSRPDTYAEADFRVLGEVEGIITDFVAAWERGERQGRFDAPKFQSDVTKTPIPRYDLINFRDYFWINLQFSRGCPFNCEFCDIIELYGRVPRTKTTPQVIAELERLLAMGYRGPVDFVDDNLIGNKKALKKFLPELKAWQQKHGFPFMFSTEASLNLSDDEELMRMLAETNFVLVFIGIESGDTDTLVSMQKKQNTRRSIAASVHRVYAAGLFAIAGFIVGFDTEGDGTVESMVETIKATSIPLAIVGLLTALPNTQLNRRLRKEGRLVHDVSNITGDQCTAGLNFETLRPRRDILADYKAVLESVYTPDAFFARLRYQISLLRRPHIPYKRVLRYELRTIKIFSNLVRELAFRRPEVFLPILRMLRYTIKTNPGALQAMGAQMLIYMHVSRFVRFVEADIGRQIAAIDAQAATNPVPVPELAPAA